ncbi:hypothetical protein BON23_5167 [Saccharomyces cerevisiae]|nr:hypothetical protein BON23_5167 [Saccharomyces cerevisiae]
MIFEDAYKVLTKWFSGIWLARLLRNVRFPLETMGYYPKLSVFPFTDNFILKNRTGGKLYGGIPKNTYIPCPIWWVFIGKRKRWKHRQTRTSGVQIKGSPSKNGFKETWKRNFLVASRKKGSPRKLSQFHWSSGKAVLRYAGSSWWAFGHNNLLKDWV